MDVSSSDAGIFRVQVIDRAAAFRIPKTTVPALAEAVMAIAREMSAELGCRPDTGRAKVAAARKAVFRSRILYG